MQDALDKAELAEQIDDYVRGALDADSAREVEARIATSEEMRARVDLARAFVAVVDSHHVPVLSRSFVALAASALLLTLGSVVVSVAGPPDWTIGGILMGFAAWLALLTAGSVGARQWQARKEQLRSILDRDERLAELSHHAPLVDPSTPPADSP